jgi:hypothetical protein
MTLEQAAEYALAAINAMLTEFDEHDGLRVIAHQEQHDLQLAARDLKKALAFYPQEKRRFAYNPSLDEALNSADGTYKP